MKQILLICSLIISFNSFSYDAASDWTKVSVIYSPVSGTKPYITFESAVLEGCYGNSGAYLPVSNEAASARVYSTLLAAKSAGKEVRVFFNYNSVPTDYNGWGLCDIEAVYLR
ncbi:MAG: hypothetical protein HWE27_10605 [Gammaproteobacteria bacterium]|nr:hypothetical protein [Gammaproteobacteria bacterium]